MVGFYNCENLFDTLDNAYTQDQEYLPTSKKHWNTKKYNEKLAHIARVILAMSDWEGPDIVGLCEVENKQVVEDLIHKTYLNQHDYRIIHKESRDIRGIDVAMIYKASAFELIRYEYIRLFEDKDTRPTRDILYAKGFLKQADTVHLFFNHWPSRFEGVAETKNKRAFAATILRQQVDRIFEDNPQALILIAGDFNDDVDNTSMTQNLGAHTELNDSLTPPYLFNTSYALKKEKKWGSHKHQGRWSIFDQWIVSSGVLDNSHKLTLNPRNSIIFQREWMMQEDNQSFGLKPFRSYEGDAYIGGYSDHLPVCIKLDVK